MACSRLRLEDASAQKLRIKSYRIRMTPLFPVVTTTLHWRDNASPRWRRSYPNAPMKPTVTRANRVGQFKRPGHPAALGINRVTVDSQSRFF